MPACSFPLQVGQPDVLPMKSPDERFAVVFEDDGRTGYFYALDYTVAGDQKIQEAMSIYDVEAVADRDIPSEVVIAWSDDSSRAALFINGHPHALFDFARQRGYCRNPFIGPLKWGATFKWDDAAFDRFMRDAKKG